MVQYYLHVSVSYLSCDMAFLIHPTLIILCLPYIMCVQMITNYGYAKHLIHYTTSPFCNVKSWCHVVII